MIEKVAIKKKWYQKFLASDHVIFLGVFKELSEKTSISAGIYRLAYLFLFFIGIVTKASILIPVLIFSYILGFLILRTGIFRFLFSLGISVGNNREIICNLPALGGQALWLAFAGTLGSVWGAWIVYRNFFKNKS